MKETERLKQIAICTGKDCRKHKKIARKLMEMFPEAQQIPCLKVCKSPVVVVQGVIVTKLRKKKHLDWLFESVNSGDWHPKLYKRILQKKKKKTQERIALFSTSGDNIE